MKTENLIQIQFDFADTVPVVEKPRKQSNDQKTDQFVFEFMDLLTAPIITYTTSWADAIPPQLKKDIQLARLISGMSTEKMATIPETVAYIMTRTYEAPMNHEWTNIYLWCSAQYMKQYRNKTDSDFQDMLVPEKLDEHEESLLKKLRVWIFDKRREYVKQKIKQSSIKTNTNQLLTKNEHTNELF